MALDRHQADDALAGDALAVLGHGNVALEAVGGLDEQGGRPGMDPETVLDGHRAGLHRMITFLDFFRSHIHYIPSPRSRRGRIVTRRQEGGKLESRATFRRLAGQGGGKA